MGNYKEHGTMVSWIPRSLCTNNLTMIQLVWRAINYSWLHGMASSSESTNYTCQSYSQSHVCSFPLTFSFIEFPRKKPYYVHPWGNINDHYNKLIWKANLTNFLHIHTINLFVQDLSKAHNNLDLFIQLSNRIPNILAFDL